MALEAMVRAAVDFPRHVARGLDAAEDAALPSGPFTGVLVAGMGGSAIGGTLAAALLDPVSRIPLRVVRDHGVPGFVGPGSLIVATSYSGATRETLDAVRTALDKGARLVAVTTGGELAHVAAKGGGSVIRVPAGYQPRAAIGWLFATTYGVLARSLGIGDIQRVRTAANELEATAEGVAAPGGRAAALAERIGDGPIGVVGHDILGVVARRWAGSINENAKRIAFHSVLPEMAHNQFVGWDGDPDGCTLILLRRKDEGKLEGARTRLLAERATAAGAKVVEVELGGVWVRPLLEGVLVGDLMSLHLARLAGVDPEPIPVISELKKRLIGAK